MSSALPSIEHVYQNFIIDSTRWDNFEPRNDDVIVATPYKCGTTWMQNIVLQLIFQDGEPKTNDDYSRWLDNRIPPIDGVLDFFQAQKHRRCIKSHLPLDGLRFLPEAKYIVVGRDPRDVFMSMWNHYKSYTPEFFKMLENMPDRVGPMLEPCPEDIRELWAMWVNKGWFDWETEGYPHWSNFRHVQTWWDFKHLPNILYVHYNDMLADLSGEIARVAEYLDIEVSNEMLATITDLTTFKSMKRDALKQNPENYSIFKGGAATFINKGTNGRWHDVLTEEDLEMYDATAHRELSDNCRAWLEYGKVALV